MQKFRVSGGVATIGADETIGLTAEQIKPRAHNVVIVVKGEDGQRSVVRSKVPLQFKVGEEIELESLPKHLAALLAPVVGEGQLALEGATAPRAVASGAPRRR